jgi:hypothetical protein
MHLSAIIQFFRLPLNVLVPTPGGTRTPGWESLDYTIEKKGFDSCLGQAYFGPPPRPHSFWGKPSLISAGALARYTGINGPRG